MASYKATVCLGRENICKNCIKEDVCKVAEDFYKEPVYGMYIEDCDYFKDRNRFIELPCKVGDTVYYIAGLSRKIIKPAIVKEIIINCNGVSKLSVETNALVFESPFVSTFYLTKEEAERALNSSEKSNS